MITATRSGRAAPPEWIANVITAVAALGFGVTLGLGLTAETRGSLVAPGGLATAAGRLAGLTGSYLLLVMLLLISRLPWLEGVFGQDRLVRWHRRIGPWPIVLLGTHAVLITIGYAQQASVGPWHELRVLLTSYPDVLMGTAAFGLLVMAGVTSFRAARSRMHYETWWAVHLYTYLAIALAFSHQLADGASFVGHPLARLFWVAVWASTAGVVLVYRVGLPLWRTLYHRLRVVEVRREGRGVVSVICAGRHLEQLPVIGGQFLQWRFLTSGLWWQAHPYSVSALPRPPYLRVTIKALGDFSESVANLPAGTRVAIEGPYGVVTKHSRSRDKVLLVAAGVGITPLRALLEDLPDSVDVVVLLRAPTPEEVIFHSEIASLVQVRGGHLHVLVGSRHRVRLDPRLLRELVPDIRRRDLYLCGPQGFTDQVVDSARRLGLRDNHIHMESFAF
ncbi:MAG TPA: ferredoxin reductase family protein [Acidimicrobiales bacterium]|nr:ferredoxin reductase family protein [Acidimicrobiales bacterium]